MSDNPRLEGILRKAVDEKGLFDGLSDGEEAFVRNLVERDSPLVALRVSGLNDPRFAAEVCVQRLCAKPTVGSAIKAYRAVYAEKRKTTVTIESLIADLCDVYDLAMRQSDFAVALEAKQTQMAILLGRQGADAKGAKA